MTTRVSGFVCLLAGVLGAQTELVEVRRIWDKAPHNAFTDLVRFKGRWFCVFREGKAHVSPDGVIRVLASRDGASWASSAVLSVTGADLRDPKLSVAPHGRLMINAAAALQKTAEARHQSLVWLSSDGRGWSEPTPVGERNMWLWRITWRKGTAYGVGYSTAGSHFVRLYASRDGRKFETVVETLFDRGYPNESSILFPDGRTALCLLRRDEAPATAQLGIAEPPYHAWSWKDLGIRLGGPNMTRLPGGLIVAAGRLSGGNARTALCRLDPESGTLTELLALPSGGDTGYPGLVWHKGLLWISYYSSHEGKTSIYLAKVRLR